MLAERQPETLPSTTESNPSEHCKAITLRSGKQLSSSLPVADNDDIVVQDGPARKELEPEEIEPVRAEDNKNSSVRECRKYAKFLKEILSNKRKLEHLGLVTLNEECSAILQNKLTVKRRDLGSFTIPCVIDELLISGALADLGASINLMPTSLFDRLSLSEPKPTRMSIQLADMTIKIPRGIVKEVLVKVDKFIFSVDFFVIDMEGESIVPLILGRPFLATSRTVIDGDEKDLSNEQVLEQLACLLASEPNRSTDLFISLNKSDVQKVVPKKGGMTMIKNEKDELIPTRTVTDFQVYTDSPWFSDYANYIIAKVLPKGCENLCPGL
eukprot:XP_015578857.1 uncharacterized protein LOC107261776 [Ricinus communis]